MLQDISVDVYKLVIEQYLPALSEDPALGQQGMQILDRQHRYRLDAQRLLRMSGD